MINQKDLASIERQLGRTPAGEFVVTSYTPNGEVQVIQSRPFMNGKPFPNLYWLVCEKLKYAIDRIEAAGWVKRLEEEILVTNEEMKKSLIIDHYRYMKERWSLAQESDFKSIESVNLLKPLASTGIGGISDFERVRCLHMHYAFHLAQGSTLGAWLDQNFQLGEIYRGDFELSL